MRTTPDPVQNGLFEDPTAAGRTPNDEADWQPSSWRALPAGHQPRWPKTANHAAVLARLAALPPLVFAGEARRVLRRLLRGWDQGQAQSIL